VEEAVEEQPKKRAKNAIPAVLRISREKAKELCAKRLAKTRVVDNGREESLSCWFDTGMIQNAYPSVSWSHTEANVQVSHLALRVGSGAEDDSLVPFASEP